MLILRDLLGRGARAVITTMQRPGQAAAEQVLIRFYAEMRAGAPPAQALRASQMRMLNDPQFADPAHWAPFFYSGIP
jgi:CHAT domain-containing protein